MVNGGERVIEKMMSPILTSFTYNSFRNGIFVTMEYTCSGRTTISEMRSGLNNY